MGEVKAWLGPIGRREGGRSFGRACGERCERVAQRAGFGLTFARMSVVVDVDELAVLVDVLDRMLESGLPTRKERDREPRGAEPFPEERYA
jgi:hypothetical protein